MPGRFPARKLNAAANSPGTNLTFALADERSA